MSFFDIGLFICVRVRIEYGDRVCVPIAVSVCMCMWRPHAQSHTKISHWKLVVALSSSLFYV